MSLSVPSTLDFLSDNFREWFSGSLLQPRGPQQDNLYHEALDVLPPVGRDLGLRRVPHHQHDGGGGGRDRVSPPALQCNTVSFFAMISAINNCLEQKKLLFILVILCLSPRLSSDSILCHDALDQRQPVCPQKVQSTGNIRIFIILTGVRVDPQTSELKISI